MKNLVFVFACILCWSCLAHSQTIPSVFKICHRDDPKLNTCLKKSLRSLLPHFVKGFPELKVESLDPYTNDRYHVLEYKQNQIYLKSTVSNSTAIGLSKAKVHGVRADIQDEFLNLEIDLSVEKIFMDGNFRMQGKYNAINLKSFGWFNCTMQGLTFTWNVKGKPFTKNGKTYIKITDFIMRPDVDQLVVSFTDIIPDSPGLSKFFLDFANANWKPLYRELLPYAEKAWGKSGILLCNKIFTKIPYDELFPSKHDDK